MISVDLDELLRHRHGDALVALGLEVGAQSQRRSSCHYRGNDYAFHANGQTGKIDGNFPLSWVKILCAVLGVILALMIFGYMGD